MNKSVIPHLLFFFLQGIYSAQASPENPIARLDLLLRLQSIRDKSQPLGVSFARWKTSATHPFVSRLLSRHITSSPSLATKAKRREEKRRRILITYGSRVSSKRRRRKKRERVAKLPQSLFSSILSDFAHVKFFLLIRCSSTVRNDERARRNRTRTDCLRREEPSEIPSSLSLSLP